jgi:hypothetical protein
VTLAGFLVLAALAVDAPPRLPERTPEGLRAWLVADNDFFAGRLLNADDFRTGGGQAGLGWRHQAWTAAAAYGYAALTLRAPTAVAGARSDEQTLAAGLFWHGATDALRGRVGIGGGWRTAGRYGGGLAQNALHRRIDDAPVELPYSDQGQSGLVWASTDLTWRAIPAAAGGLIAGGLDLGLHTRAAPTFRGGVPWDAGVRATSTGASGWAWVQARFAGFDRRCLSGPAAATSRHESGWWVGAGMTIASSGTGSDLTYAAEVAPGTGATIGSIGLSTGAAHPGGAGERSARQTIAYGEGSRGLAVTAALPAAWLPRGRWWTTALATQWRWGQVAAEAARIREADQLTTGIEARCAIPDDHGLVADLGVHLLTGCRVERLTTPTSRAVAWRPVTSCGLSVHAGAGNAWPALGWASRLRPGVAVRWHVPWRTATTADGERFQTPVRGIDWECSVTTAW